MSSKPIEAFFIQPSVSSKPIEAFLHATKTVIKKTPIIQQIVNAARK
jgi:hypothetical protein